MNALNAVAACTLLSGGCQTLSGSYRLLAETADGQALANNFHTIAYKDISTARNAMCRALAGQNALIRIYRLDKGGKWQANSAAKVLTAAAERPSEK